MICLSIIANIAAILTALVAVFGYGYYHFEKWRKCKRLESYLKSEKANGKDEGQRTLLHLMANVGMTEAELLQASFRSKHIDHKIAVDKENNMAKILLLEWVD